MDGLDDGPGSSRRRPVTAAQWAIARELSEGRPATRVRVAAALGVDVGSLHAHAAREGWIMVDYRRQEVLALHREAVELSASYRGEEGLEPWPHDEGLVGAAVGVTAGDAACDAGQPGDMPAAGALPGGAEIAVEDAPDAVEMMARASRFVARQILGLMDRADRRGGRLDKGQIDGLVAMSRMMERWEAVAQERRIEERKKSDDELAGLLRDIDTRIIDLAQAEAKRLCEEKAGRPAV